MNENDGELSERNRQRDYEFQKPNAVGFMFRPQYYIVHVLINMTEMPTTTTIITRTIRSNIQCHISQFLIQISVLPMMGQGFPLNIICHKHAIARILPHSLNTMQTIFTKLSYSIPFG